MHSTPEADRVDDPSALASLTSALVDANDQLLALYALTDISRDSLDDEASVEEILNQASRLMAADALVFTVHDGPSISTGNGKRDAQHTSPTGDQPSSLAPTTTAIEVSNSSGLTATLVARRMHRPFGTADHKLLTAVANMSLGAVHTARLHREAIDQAIVARDHDTASQLAVRALPQWQPSLSGAELFTRSLPARAAGGDLYAYAELDDTLHFVVGDVSGKGLPAAMMMTNVISASLAAFQETGRSGPAAVLTQIDAWMYDFLSDSGLFVTLLAGSYNQRSGELHLANAGHSPVIWVQGGAARTVEAASPPIGVLPLASMGPVEEETFVARPGDRLVVSSDGFTEQLNSAGEMFGEERLVELILRHGEPGAGQAAKLGELLFETIADFAGTIEQGDDRTLLLLAIEGQTQ